MSRALMQQTVIRLAVEIETDREDILAQLIAVIMALFVGGRWGWQMVSRAVVEAVTFWRDVAAAVRYVWTVYAIRFRAYAWGFFGVRL